MEYGTMINVQKKWRDGKNMANTMQILFASPVNVIESIVITKETDPNEILADWSAFDPSINVYSDLTADQSVKLFINWSDKNGTINLHQGDYFTFVIPDIFMHDLVHDATDVDIKNEAGEVVATYSIYDNDNNKKEVKITFTDFVESNTNISGYFWALLFVGRVDSTEHKNIVFIINGSVVAEGEVTINPDTVIFTPNNQKVGFSSPTMKENGYYIFEWEVYINMEENIDNGFNTLQDFSFEDVIPSNSPHTFLTEEIRQGLGLLPTDYETEIGEYTGADSALPENRYQIFMNHYNDIGDDIWYNFIDWYPMNNGFTTVGIDGQNGLNVSDVQVTDKIFSANPGTLTRPTVITFYTLSTIKLTESALGDSEVVELFKNTFKRSSGEDLNSTLTLYRFEAGGGAQGIHGDYSFSFIKVNENDAVLPHAMFSLFTSSNLELGADRFVFSGNDGVVTFRNLSEGTFYLQETVTPFGYVPNDTIYKVVISSEGFEIYYGDNFENRLSDHENKIVNISEFEVQPVSLTLTGIKKLTGKTLTSGMFSFVVKDNDGVEVASGTNADDGSIIFSEIEFNSPGVYIFTIEEVEGDNSGIINDGSKFTVTVTVVADGNENLTVEVDYPEGGIVFNNSYSTPPVSPCQCYARAIKCRRSIEGKKIWVDNDNAYNRRPDNIEILLIRDGDVYKRTVIDSGTDWTFTFCCLPIWKNSGHKYNYRIDEATVPDGYTKTIDGYNVINTFTP